MTERAAELDSLTEAGRFSILRRLGAGGMGVVYLARDSAGHRLVALKTLLAFEASEVSRLKHEFRALTGISHPNLVELYELCADGDRWFFTMEYVEGSDFFDHARGVVAPPRRHDGTVSAWATQRFDAEQEPGVTRDLSDSGELDPTLAPEDLKIEVNGIDATRPAGLGPMGVEGIPRPAQRPMAIDEGLLRPALAQLARAVQAIHAAGLLHLDIKPSNVLVTSGGRVVVLDFGLVAELRRGRHHDQAHLRAAGGTAGYMAPEQVTGQPVSEASDWYGVGAMLYEILTGRLPFQGTLRDILLAKATTEPPPPSAVHPGAPEDLSALCEALLRTDPTRRPTGIEVLKCLGEAPGTVESAAAVFSAPPRALIGREGHLRKLREAFETSRAGGAAVVMLDGRSGMGKSALVNLFLDEIALRGEALVLAGRCYERESVPYKAFDSLVDGLLPHLAQRSPEALDALLPPEIAALAQLFPVLGQVSVIARKLRESQGIPDPQELRRRGFLALRRLLDRLAAERPLVLFIDDLQWGDLDSAALLSALLRPPDPLKILLLCSYRSEDIAQSPMLLALGREWDAGTLEAPIRVTVGPLSEDEARALALSVLGADCPDRPNKADRVARESAGHPYFVSELARHVERSDEAGTGAAVSLDEMIWGRVRVLPPDARELLEIVAVAGRPITNDLAFRALRMGDPSPESGAEHALHLLQARSMIRTRGVHREDDVETFHDRVRESIVDRLEPDRLRALHARLANMLAAERGIDAEQLLVHLEGAGDREEAGRYAEVAAARAAEALAFDRAAMLYARALELRPQATTRQALLEKLADALANAGRGGDAGKAYLAAASDVSGAHSLNLRRRAAEQFLISGHIDDGTATLRAVLADVDMRLAPTPKRALFSVVGHRLFLRVRGLGFDEQRKHPMTEEVRTRIDICWAAAVGLSMVDNVRASDFQARHLLLALRSGNLPNVARALTFELGFVGGQGTAATAKVEALTATAEALSTRVGTPYALAFLVFMKGVSDYLGGRFNRCFSRCEEADTALRERCSGVTWELTSAQRFSLGSLMYMGQLRELSRRVPALLARAEERGNLYAATDLRTRFTLTWLAKDDPDRARREIDEASARWSVEGFHLQHYNALLATEQRDLYLDEPEVAWKRLDERWRAIERSMLLRIQLLRAEVVHLRARLALACAAHGGNVARYLKLAGRDAAAIEKERAPWADPLATLVRATIAAARQDKERAAQLAEQAAAGFDGADMGLYAAVARRRQGELVGGEEGRSRVAAANAWMQGEDIRDPDRMTNLFAPGPWLGTSR